MRTVARFVGRLLLRKGMEAAADPQVRERLRERLAEGSGEGRGGMFERFTDDARRVVILAEKEARLVCHQYIGTEHLLLGLLREEATARVLGPAGVSLDAARRKVEELIGAGTTVPQGHIPFTPRAKRGLELSFEEAQGLDHDRIAAEHILLGVLAEGEGAGTQVLASLGQDLGELRTRTLREIRGRAEASWPAVDHRRWAPSGRSGEASSHGAADVGRAVTFSMETVRFDEKGDWTTEDLVRWLQVVNERLDSIDRRLAAIERRLEEGRGD